ADAEERMRRRFPRVPDRSSAAGRAILTGDVAEIPDVEAEPDYAFASDVRAGGLRANTAVPMLRDGRVIGTINLGRTVAGRFSELEIALLKTFADQAVIAIENVRLFKELEARNRDLTATGEILRVIAGSPTDIHPVFETIFDNATRLCDAQRAGLFLFDGETYRAVAFRGANPALIEHHTQGLIRPGPRPALGRMVGELRPVHIHDVAADAADGDPVRRAVIELEGMRTLLMVPLLREARLVGALSIYRREVHPFTDEQTALLQPFADQAVIAIENVRLFEELQASNKHLTDALDKQTATGEILRAISRSQTDVPPVFEAILYSAVRLLGAYTGALTRVVDNQIELAAFTQTDDAGAAALRAAFRQSLQSELPHAQAIRDRAPLNIPDAQTDPRLPEAEHVRARVRGFRSRVLVPLLRQDEALGVISVARREPGGFNADEISLLQTFADQAVIAIENARLLTALPA